MTTATEAPAPTTSEHASPRSETGINVTNAQPRCLLLQIPHKTDVIEMIRKRHAMQIRGIAAVAIGKDGHFILRHQCASERIAINVAVINHRLEQARKLKCAAKRIIPG